MPNMKLSKDFRSSAVNEELFSDVNEDKFSMTIDPKSMNHIIARLTDLYADPIVATVREIISNAIDATRAIPEEKRKPIDVFVPTLMSSEFDVTDHALGLSLSEIKNIYTRYGASTKESDFSQIGAYGLGSKAPLSYTSEFTVETAKDGMYTSILVTVENGINTVKILAHGTTDKDNFMKVSIPVKKEDIDSFANALKTYKEHPMKDISFNGLDDIEADNVDKFLGTMDYNGIPLNIYIPNNNIIDYLMSLLRNKETDSGVNYVIKGILSGYEYVLLDNNRWNELDFSIELVPGIVDFSSSRDEITNTIRKKNLIEAFEKFMTQDEAINDFIKLLNLDDNLKRTLFVRCLDANLYERLNDDEKKKLFTLSSGYVLGQSTTRALGIIDGFRNIVEYTDNHSLNMSSIGNVSRINSQINIYFNPDEYDKYNKKNNQEKLSVNAIKHISTVPLYSVSHWSSHSSHFIIVYDVNDAKSAKRVLRNRNVFFKYGSNNSDSGVLVILEGKKSDYEDELNKLLPKRPIQYFSQEEFNKKSNEYRRENIQTIKKDNKKDLYSAESEGSCCVDNSLNLYEYIHGSRITDLVGLNNIDSSKVNLKIAVINRSWSDSIPDEKILPYLLLMKEDVIARVSLFKAQDLLLRNFDYLNETFDYVLNLASEDDYRSSQLFNKLNDLLLPVPKTIDIEKENISELTKKLLRSLVLRQEIVNISDSTSDGGPVYSNYRLRNGIEDILRLLAQSSHDLPIIPDFNYARSYDLDVIENCDLVSNNPEFNSMIDKLVTILRNAFSEDSDPIKFLATERLKEIF